MKHKPEPKRFGFFISYKFFDILVAFGAVADEVIAAD
jgi:hypothetical protein